MTAAIDLGISAGVGFLVGLVAYLVMWLFDLISQPQRFPHRGAHIERPRAAEVDLVGRHTSGHMDRAKALSVIKESREAIAVSLEVIAIAEDALRQGVVSFDAAVGS